MRTLRRFLARFGGWWDRPARDGELAEEFEAHIEMETEDGVRSGLSRDEARRRAMLRAGSLEPAKEAVRDMWTHQWLETTAQDCRYALRGLRRSPGFTATAVFSLMLGLGGCIAIFAVADNLLLRPLPYRNSSELVMLWERNTQRDLLNHNVISPGNYFDWKAQGDVFQTVGAFREVRSVLAEGERVEEFGKQAVSAELLPMLGVQPIRGRHFTGAEDRPGDGTVILISHRLWQSWFGGSDTVIGRKVQVNSTLREIVGVMPAGFYFRNRDIDIWEPIGLNPAQDYRKTQGRWMMSVARLKPGVSQEQAQERMTIIGKRLEQAYPVFNKNWTVIVEPLRDSLVRDVRTSLYLLMCAVGLMLAVACANVANLLLARCLSRRKEIAVRASLGAGRARVARLLFTESMVLGLLGGVLGLVMAHWAVKGLLLLAPKTMTNSVEVALDFRIALAALALAVFTGILFGILPAIYTMRANVSLELHSEGRSVAGGGGRARAWLVASEVALSVILLAGAGLLFRSLTGLQSVDPGMNPKNLLTFRVSVPAVRYRETLRTQFFSRVLEQMRALPGVRAASAVSYLPFAGLPAGTYVGISGRPPAKPGEELLAAIRTVMPGYFATMGIPLKNGRDFTNADNDDEGPHRFIVNEAFVRKFLRGEDPLTKQINALMSDNNPFGDIVGVVGDLKEGSLDKEPQPTVYYPHARLVYGSMIIVVRTNGEPLALVEPVRRIIKGLDPALPIAEARSMKDVLGETIARNRLNTILLVAFSVIALTLAAVGIYGILAYSVSQRAREIGVRVSLGATPDRITAMVVRSGVQMVMAGAVAGLAGALALSGLLRELLFGVEPRDPLTFVLAPLVLIAVSLVAAYVPARKAARIDPVEALRAE